MKQAWPVWTLGVLGAALALDAIIIALAAVGATTRSCDSTAVSNGVMLLIGFGALVWLLGPFAALVVAGVRDQYTRHVPSALALAFMFTPVVFLTHFATFVVFFRHSEWCGGIWGG